MHMHGIDAPMTSPHMSTAGLCDPAGDGLERPVRLTRSDAVDIARALLGLFSLARFVNFAAHVLIGD